ncbi:hypothetical protein [Sphingosinicella sp.]|uniref:hypothetical protein n=1 Tax=Sphingosinicella sp. TaxID=1917971 RepID=UPI00403838B4
MSDPLISAAARRGVISETLQQVTAGGTRTAALTIERGGLIRAGFEPIARLELGGGRLIAQGEAVGVLEGGTIYEFVNGGRVPVAALRGFIPSRGVAISSANGTSRVHIQRNLFVQVLEIRDGFYRIRLPGGQVEWLAAELVALTMVAAANDADNCGDSLGLLIRASGQSIAFDNCSRGDGFLHLETADGMMLIDNSDVAEIIPAHLEDTMARAVRFTGGYSLYGNAERLGDVVRIVDERGGVTIADIRRIENITRG